MRWLGFGDQDLAKLHRILDQKYLDVPYSYLAR